jgi:hypothetical protein
MLSPTRTVCRLNLREIQVTIEWSFFGAKLLFWRLMPRKHASCSSKVPRADTGENDAISVL